MTSMRRVASSVILLYLASPAWSQLSLSTLNTAAPTIDFTSTISGVNNGAFNGSGFQATPTTGQLNSNAWAVTGWSDGVLAFGGTRTTTNTDYTRGSSTSGVTTGGIYNFNVGGGNANSFGIQPGGSDWAPGTVTLRVQNNTGSVLSSLIISYDVFINNDQGRSNSFNFSHSANDSTYTQESTLDITSNGTADALGFQQNSRNITLTGLNITDGSFYYLRWSGADAGGSGSRDEFALDNISVTPVPEPATILGLSAAGFGLVGFARRLRRKSSI